MEQQTARRGHGVTKPAPTGIEGREEDFGHAVAALIKTFSNRQPYEHEFNDALVKAHLTFYEFARELNAIPMMQEHEQKTMSPILTRVKAQIEETGDKELALVGMMDATACHYQLVKKVEAEPLARTFPCPYSRVHAISSRIGQHTFPLQEMHDNFCKSRYYGFAKQLGVDIEVSDCHGEECTVRILSDTDKVPVSTPRNTATA
jgi:hypothetical protein